MRNAFFEVWIANPRSESRCRAAIDFFARFVQPAAIEGIFGAIAVLVDKFVFVAIAFDFAFSVDAVGIVRANVAASAAMRFVDFRVDAFKTANRLI